jgi:hypothetical protein
VVFAATESCRREESAVRPTQQWLSVGWRAPHRVLKEELSFFLKTRDVTGLWTSEMDKRKHEA